MTTLYVVVPCYNEEEVLPETSKRLAAKLTDLESQGRRSPSSTGRTPGSAGSSFPGTGGTRTPFWPG